MYDINSNILSASGVNADQLFAAIKAIRPDTGFTDAKQFTDAEAKYGINALFVAAHAAIESAWGTSYYARTRNNLFGFNAIDSDPDQASSYPSQSASTDYYASFLKKYYLTPGAVYYNGTTPHGVFVKYSSSHDAEAQSVVGLMNALASHIGNVPTPPAPEPTPPQPSGNVYTVVTGDNMSNIAARHGMSLGQLEALNPHAGHPAGNFDNIWPGDHIVINGSPVPPENPSTVTVKQGDTMSAIAQRNGITLGRLESMNPNAGHPAGNFDNIWPGDQLRIA